MSRAVTAPGQDSSDPGVLPAEILRCPASFLPHFHNHVTGIVGLPFQSWSWLCILLTLGALLKASAFSPPTAVSPVPRRAFPLPRGHRTLEHSSTPQLIMRRCEVTGRGVQCPLLILYHPGFPCLSSRKKKCIWLM